MRILYSIRTEREPLPEPKVIFENARRWHGDFTADPTGFYQKHEEWIKPMNQLKNGLFLSGNWDNRPLPFKSEYVQNSTMKLEMEFVAKNFIRVYFDTENCIPYRVDTGKIN